MPTPVASALHRESYAMALPRVVGGNCPKAKMRLLLNGKKTGVRVVAALILKSQISRVWHPGTFHPAKDHPEPLVVFPWRVNRALGSTMAVTSLQSRSQIKSGGEDWMIPRPCFRSVTRHLTTAVASAATEPP